MNIRDALKRMRALSKKAEHRYWTINVDGQSWTVLTDGVGFVAVQTNAPIGGEPTAQARRWLTGAIRLVGKTAKRMPRATVERWILQCPRKLDCGYLVGRVDDIAFDRKRVRRWLELMPGTTFDMWVRRHRLGHTMMIRNPRVLVGIMSMWAPANMGPVLRLRTSEKKASTP